MIRCHHVMGETFWTAEAVRDMKCKLYLSGICQFFFITDKC
jgi:hypothetical protein